MSERDVQTHCHVILFQKVLSVQPERVIYWSHGCSHIWPTSTSVNPHSCLKRVHGYLLVFPSVNRWDGERWVDRTVISWAGLWMKVDFLLFVGYCVYWILNPESPSCWAYGVPLTNTTVTKPSFVHSSLYFTFTGLCWQLKHSKSWANTSPRAKITMLIQYRTKYT